MDTSSSTPQPLPRLRVLRSSPQGRRDTGNASLVSSQAGPSRLTDFSQLVDLHMSDVHAAHVYTDEDEDEDQYPTPRLNAAASLAPSSATPTPNLAGRLRELLHRVNNAPASQTTPTPHRPPSPTFHESDFEGESAAAGQSHARESLRDIFSKALREPGDTPQKSRQRNNSDSGSSDADASPRAARNRSDIKGKRKSFNDEESMNPMNSENHSSYLPNLSQHPVLRTPRDANAIDFPLKSISAEDSDDLDDFPHLKRNNLPDVSNIPLQSLRISQNSSFPQHSNLMDQNSEMQRAFGELDSSDAASTHSHEPHEANAPEDVEPNTPVINSSLKLAHTDTYTHKRPRKSFEYNTPTLSNQTASTIKPTPRQPDQNVISNGRSTGQRRTSLNGSTTSVLKYKSPSSSQFSDHSSAMSVSDYGDRMKEMERERNREREREWNKPHPTRARTNSNVSINLRTGPRSRTSSISSLESPRPASALSNMSVESGESSRVRVRTSSGLSERPRTISGGNRPGSALSNESSVADFPQGLRRHHSLTTRVDSPMSSNNGRAHVEETQFEIEQEREKNWNAPRPQWHRRSLTNTPDRQASPASSKPATPHSPANGRRESTTPSTALKDASNTTRSGSSLGQRHPQTKAISPSPTPTERKGGASFSGKSPYSSRLSTVTTSTTPHSQSPLTGQTSRKSRLPVPSPRTNGSKNTETPKTIPNFHVTDGGEGMLAKSAAFFPQTANGPSLSQVSMEFTEAYNGHETDSGIPSFSDFSHDIPTPNNDTMHTASLLGPSDSQGAIDDGYQEDEENPLTQEQTPVLRTVNQLGEESEVYDVQESSSAQAREDFMSLNEDPEPSLPAFEPLDSSSMPSFLSTPPRSRQSSFNSSRLVFQTPSPPKNLPDLPGPPPASGDNTEEDEPIPQFNITPAAIDITPDLAKRADMTTFKTPKPPGAWFATPGPSPNMMGGEQDSTHPFVDSSDDNLINTKAHSQATYPQTPAPPGGWAYTPVAHQRTHSDPKTVLNEGGLSTPVGSLGRNATPMTPGFGNASRKSILKVRFDPDVASLANGSSDLLPEGTISDKTNGSSPVAKLRNGVARPATPEPITPTTPPSRSPRKHKRSPKSPKSPGLRVVDAYGNEQRGDNIYKREPSSPTPTTPRSKSGIRIVDALGQEVTGEVEPLEEDAEDKMGLSQIAPMDRMETLQRVRQGIQELAEGLESLDLTTRTWDDDSARLTELNETSQALKQSRQQLTQDMHKAEKQLRRQAQQKVIAASWLGKNGWFLLFVAVTQLVLIFIMYRASVLRARKMFLTNYYDPFNPDLFLYTTNPNTQYAKPITSWNLVTQAIRSRDLTAFMGAFRDNLSILIKRWHQQVWDVWGDDPNRPIGTWPPT